MDQFENPYASPSPEASKAPYSATDIDIVGGLHCDGKILVATKNAVFPDRCVKCNAPAEGYRLRRALYWHPPVYYIIIILCNLIIYAVVALIVRKTATFEIGLCDEHRRKRRNAILIAWGLVLLFIVFLVVAINSENGIAGIAAGVVLIAGIVVGVVGSQIISPKRIDDRHAWIKGAGPEFLASVDQSAA